MRCRWCESNELMINYHDQEWGIPCHDDQKLFEYLMLESLQCGLSWMIIMKKREAINQAFHHFDLNYLTSPNCDIEDIMHTEGMLKSERKIKAVIKNAYAYVNIQKEFGSFDHYLWSFTHNKIIQYKNHEKEDFGFITHNDLSDIISHDLKKRGFSFLGSVTIYSYLQAMGMINDHKEYCFRYQEILNQYEIEYKE